MINLELFSCAGGMAEGMRRTGIAFDMAFDFEPEHCDSYEKNLGHRPIGMDVRDLLRMVRAGWKVDVDLLVADPPCTPWSRAGKRRGTADERDMLQDTCDLIALLRPRRYLIGNVPGLDDSKNWLVVQQVIGGLQHFGYCVADFAALDAADYGVPQHRIRPFWFGHRAGPCIQWPKPTHCDPQKLATPALFESEQLLPWVTCRQALGHLSGDELGRPVRLRQRATANRHDDPEHASVLDEPARALTTQCRAAGHATTILVTSSKHPAATPDEPSPTLRAVGGGNQAMLAAESGRKRSRARDVGRVGQGNRVGRADEPCATGTAKSSRVGAGQPHVLEWPWDQPATCIHCDERIAPPGHHDEWSIMSTARAVVLSERAAAILQGFPESWVFVGETKKARWSQLGQALPPALAEAVGRSIVDQQDRLIERISTPWSKPA